MTVITSIEVSTHRVDVDPPFAAGWDPLPRATFAATIVRIRDDSGLVGIGSGDTLDGLHRYTGLFIGEDPTALRRHEQVLSNIDFHGARPWPVGLALWDLAGQHEGVPLYEMLGGVADRVRPYVSTGVLHDPEGLAAAGRDAISAGFGAMKIRFGRTTLEDDLEALAYLRRAVGAELALMVDCNQGWRMPWDTTQPWDLTRARQVAAELERLDVLWMEEPLHRGDHRGMAALRAEVAAVRIAGGEMTRSLHELTALLEHGCLDVYQPDAVLTVGLGGLREFAERVLASGAWFTPHTWGNGIGLLANLHLVAGVGGGPFLELPLDPPAWVPRVRDFMLRTPIEPVDGVLACPSVPGLGAELDEDLLSDTLIERVVYE